MPKLRRTQALYVTLDPFLSPHAKVLHHFEQFLEGIYESEFPCIWLTSLTRAQLDEPRRRLGHADPFIGESGGGVYLPEDYFHLKSGDTIRLGRFTCIPVAKPQPAASEALDDLAAELGISVVPLRSLSQRELSQNTGLPESEAAHMRMRDFDELFFFAGATESDIAHFGVEANLRGLTLQNLGAFWSISVGGDLGKCVRELGALYDRALRTHVLRVAIAVSPSPDVAEAANVDPRMKALAGSCDRTLLITERKLSANLEEAEEDSDEQLESAEAIFAEPSQVLRPQTTFYLRSPDLWDNVLSTIFAKP